MIAFLTGKLLEKNPSNFIVDVGGIGYDVFIPLSTFYQAGENGSTLSLHIQMIVREDALILYGFSTKLEKEIFIRLISVSGVGPKLALTILSGLTIDELISALKNGDIRRLSGIPGIGKKTAERLVVELRDKLTAFSVPETGGNSAPASTPESTPGQHQETLLKSDLVSALVNLGWQTAAAEKAVTQCLKEESRREFSFLLKESMKRLYR